MEDKEKEGDYLKENWKSLLYKNNIIEVSDLGNVKKNGKILNQFENHDGYLCVSLKINSNSSNWRNVQVGRLVAMAFIEKPNNVDEFEVNHKDYNRKNNNVNNLEWLTHADNVRYSNCNRPNMSGKNNPNYGNHKLSNIYKNNLSLSLKNQSRKGIKNGRCRGIKLYKDNILLKEFDYIGLCMKYLFDNHISDCKNIESIRARIRESIKYNRPYKNHYTFEYVDKEMKD